jgi:hypothetical protein
MAPSFLILALGLYALATAVAKKTEKKTPTNKIEKPQKS